MFKDGNTESAFFNKFEEQAKLVFIKELEDSNNLKYMTTVMGAMSNPTIIDTDAEIREEYRTALAHLVRLGIGAIGFVEEIKEALGKVDSTDRLESDSLN